MYLRNYVDNYEILVYFEFTEFGHVFLRVTSSSSVTMIRSRVIRMCSNRTLGSFLQRCYSDLATGVMQSRDESNPADVLTDQYGRKHTYLRISLTERCNLRCK